MDQSTNSIARALHDVGLAAWFGGSLMGAVGLNGASEELSDPTERTRVVNAGWGRWQPVSALAIGAHLLGSTRILFANRSRMAAQAGVPAASWLKAGLTAAALGATAYAGVLGQKIMQVETERRTDAGGVPTEGATTPGEDTPDEMAQAQRQQQLLQWAVPALTGALLVVSARMGEQQRPSAVAKGLRSRLVG